MRARRTSPAASAKLRSDDDETQLLDSSTQASEPTAPKDGDAPTFRRTRSVIVRFTCLVYVVAFGVAAQQNTALIGEHGLLSAKSYLKRVKEHFGAPECYERVPTLLWLVPGSPDTLSDSHLQALAVLGVVLAGIPLCRGSANMVHLLLLAAIQRSLLEVGQTFYSFGWETQLFETGILVSLLCPVLDTSPSTSHQPPATTLYALRWLLFRIMLGAGLIKWRGDACWRDLTCMQYHYETQPVPGPLSWYFHHTPEAFHAFEVIVNHVVELGTPWLLLIPLTRYRWATWLTRIGGALQVLFQCTLILSGNLSFLNWLTIIPALSCFDDSCWPSVFSVASSHTDVPKRARERAMATTRTIFDWTVFAFIAWLSVPVVSNLISERQAMNTSFDNLKLVNTYGAFGSITKVRHEVVVMGTRDSNPADDAAHWEEYEFNVKPNDVSRQPPWITPWHYRLDWLMWFAAFGSPSQHPWLVHLVLKLLKGDKAIGDLLRRDPFVGGEPPKFIKADLYLYKYTPRNSSSAQNKWWTRKYEREYLPTLSLQQEDGALRWLRNHGVSV